MRSQAAGEKKSLKVLGKRYLTPDWLMFLINFSLVFLKLNQLIHIDKIHVFLWKQVTASLCGKTCDSCKHPDMVSKYLKELTSTCANQYKNGSSRIYITRSLFGDSFFVLPHTFVTCLLCCCHCFCIKRNFKSLY